MKKKVMKKGEKEEEEEEEDSQYNVLVASIERWCLWVITFTMF